ncbi:MULTISPECIES: type II toxin-antitoxin system VapC family toxin [Thermodesulfovibrio]|uniref:type II toxin-antitoxin system VapC family toxin n=1 Tax=Thermodesulfovibrio TaxID=28261 RepID=UPI00260A2329|nr:type II toxin-antitoxin system VapC family toxin [Thermodesulfovibrio sp.]
MTEIPDRLVLDASVLAAFFIKEENHEKIKEQLVAVKKLFAPSLWRFEVSNVLWKKKEISDELAIEIVKVIWELDVNDIEPNLYIKEAFRISREHNITFYDSSYIAMAKTLGVALWSFDRLQREISEKEGVRLFQI